MTALAVVIFRGIAQKDTLESRSDAERTMNILLSSLRDHENFGAALENIDALRDKVVGVAAYTGVGDALYGWGTLPAVLPLPPSSEPAQGETVSLYIDVPGNDSVALVFRPFRGAPPPPRDVERETTSRDTFVQTEGHPAPSTFFLLLRKAEYVYLEIRQPVYWRNRRAFTLLFPLVELALAALVLLVRNLVLRNAGYRRRIEEQRNLVVLGAAASTLAHEIKNPLLSIRLQTRILERTWPAEARREIEIINDEVERLSALSHRVGDYLRDPAGSPSAVDARDVARDVGMRLCGHDILASQSSCPATVHIDPERLRSVLENLVRNALESVGEADGNVDDAAAVTIDVRSDESVVRIDVLDRGQGMADGMADRVFDPFFTTKSRGTGIGLAVCRRFIQAAGGTIALENREGGGCAARVVLPVGSSPSVPLSAPSGEIAQ
jgi:two-component system sensor histidine kinase HydH